MTLNSEIAPSQPPSLRLKGKIIVKRQSAEAKYSKNRIFVASYARNIAA
jgi:hypothetical protein